MHNTRLGISIPTFNRAKYLKETLSSIIDQAKEFSIPIYISDNGSTDQTHDIIEEFKRSYVYMYFRRNESNLGIDMNILNVVKMANTEFVWLFGDDDLLEADAVKKVLEKIELGFDLVIINSSTNNLDFSKKIEDRHFKIFSDRIYGENDFNQLLLETASYTTFIGSLVVNKELWGRVTYENFLDSDFIHSGIIYSYIPGKKTYVISKPYIKIRLQNASWSHRQFIVWMINWPKVIWNLPEVYSNEIKGSIVVKKPYYSWKTVLLYRALNSYDKSLYDKFVKYDYDVSLFNKFMHLLIVLINYNFIRKLLLFKLYILRLFFNRCLEYEIERLSNGD